MNLTSSESVRGIVFGYWQALIVAMIFGLLPQCGVLHAAGKGSVSLRPGAVDTSVRLRVKHAIEAGTIIRVTNVEPSIQTALITPFGLRINTYPLMTNFLIAERRRTLTRVTNAPEQSEVLYRAIKPLPPGDYQVALTGRATRRQQLEVRVEVPGEVKRSSFWRRTKHRLEMATLVVLFSPVLIYAAATGQLSLSPAAPSGGGSSQREVPRYAQLDLSEVRNAPRPHDNRFCCTGDFLVVHARPNSVASRPLRKGQIFLEYQSSPTSEAVYLQPDGVESLQPMGTAMLRMKGSSTSFESFQSAIRIPRPGWYTFRVVLEGELASGQKLVLEGKRKIEVMEADVRFASMQASVREATGSGEPGGVRLESELTVQRDGRYLVVASLSRDARNEACRKSRTFEMFPGQRVVLMEFSAEQVRACRTAAGTLEIPPIGMAKADRDSRHPEYVFPRGQTLTVNLTGWEALTGGEQERRAEPAP